MKIYEVRMVLPNTKVISSLRFEDPEMATKARRYLQQGYLQRMIEEGTMPYVVANVKDGDHQERYLFHADNSSLEIVIEQEPVEVAV
jgi:hypothetical protein